MAVIEQTDVPITTTRAANGDTCDLHLLYLHGYGTAVKVPIAVLEGAADFFTIGLAEIVLSPTESLSRNEKKPVWFCFKNDSLTSVTVASSQTETVTASSPPAAAPAEPPEIAAPANSPAAAPTPAASSPGA